MEAAIVGLTDDPRPAGCKAVVGRPGHLRLRVGDYRVIYLPRDADLVIVVVSTAHRREVYHRY
ncbi:MULTISPECIES: type II toxin-antitoxin system RelE family toxin [Protofrankia]|uniref:type II toxin-antitoxin system RelE family toxin n=1 Tax=Protofrankia TaxID=2994361 RepID=UPI00192C9805|nr:MULTISPECIES: type II toxin-antitoxin system RelE/ParE family toxin [Protofrankia]